MEKNEGDAPDQDENAQNPEYPEIITLSSGDEDDEFDIDESNDAGPPDVEFHVDESVTCLPTTSSDPSECKQQLNDVSLQVKKELMEETSKTEVSSIEANHLDVCKAFFSQYLSEVGKRLESVEQQSSAASSVEASVSNSTIVTASNNSALSLPNIVTQSNASQFFSQYLSEVGKRLESVEQQSSAASSVEASVSNSTIVTASNNSALSLPNIVTQSNASQFFSQYLSEVGKRLESVEQQSSAASSVEASVSNSTIVTASNNSALSLPNIVTQSNASQSSPRILLRRCDHDAMEMGAKVWREEASPRILLRRCDHDAMEMGAKVWREERIVWASFGKSRSCWPGIIFNAVDIKKVEKPTHKFVLWFGTYTYSQVRKDEVFDFRRHFDEKFDPKASIKKKAVLEALKLLAEMSYISQNMNLIDWGMRYFPGFQYRDEVLIEFLRPHLERLKD